MKLMSRRRLLGSAALIAAAAATGRVGAAATSNGATTLPARGTFVIRNAYVMTMDEAGDLAGADVHVANGAIVAVGQNLKAPGAAVIDGHGMIVLPGLVETHWHMWNTLLRSMSGDKPETGYFKTTAMLGQKFEPGDMYQGTRLACAEAINNGITHVHDWCHNIRGPAYAEADLKALRESGLRARFSYGWSQGMPNNQVDGSRRAQAHARGLGQALAGRADHSWLRLARAGRQQSGNGDPTRGLQGRRSTPRANSACPSPCMPAARDR